VLAKSTCFPVYPQHQTFDGAVGVDWQFSGVGNFSGNPGETDLILRNSKTGGLEVYDIANNQLAATADRGAASGIYLACYFAGGIVGTAILPEAQITQGAQAPLPMLRPADSPTVAV
jgi:hypothetical protein